MLALIGAVVPKLVLLDRSADRAAILFVCKRKDRLSDRISCIEEGVAEIAKCAAMQGIGAALGLHIHIYSRRAPGCRIETVGDDLELGDRILRKVGLTEARPDGILRNLQSVHCDLEFASFSITCIR